MLFLDAFLSPHDESGIDTFSIKQVRKSVTTGLATLGELTGLGGGDSAPEERASFIMVFVAPYSGKTSIGSVELN